MKRSLSILLALAAALTLFPAALGADHVCADTEWDDHICDVCGETVSALCTDGEGDHHCDVCWLLVEGLCADGDGDEYCDVCWNHMAEYCADADENHVCDVCWAVLSACLDENRDHLCDLCGTVFWVDENADGVCDGCDAVLTHVTAAFVGVYHHGEVADVAIRVEVESYLPEEGTPSGTVSVRWTGEDGRVHTTMEVEIARGATWAIVEYPSLPVDLLELGGRVMFTPYDAGFTPAENGCIMGEGHFRQEDVPDGAWYSDAVYYALGNQLMDSAADGIFDPEGGADRAGFVRALWVLDGSPRGDYALPFSDVEGDAWYADAVRWAHAEGITVGNPDGTFRPDGVLTRQEMAAFLYRYERYCGGGFEGAWMFLLPCTDREQVAEWAYEPLCWLTMKGVMQGDGTGALKPQDTATRAEMAQIIMNYMEREE